MSRAVGGLAAALLLLTTAWADLPAPGPVVYGETPAFWDAHTLVDAVVEEDRLEDDGKSLATVDHLTLRVRADLGDGGEGDGASRQQGDGGVDVAAAAGGGHAGTG